MNRFPANDIASLVEGAPRYDLAESFGPNLDLAELLAAPGLDELALGYGTIAGDERLRRAIAASHGVDKEDVVITVGAAHALFLLAFILCNGGDEAVVATPVFPPARNALLAMGAKLRELPLAFERRYQPDLGALRARLSAKTKMVSFASPQNPSGVAIPTEILREILAMMADICPTACLLVDETYREAAYGDDEFAASAIDLGPRVVSVASLSKCHGAPGLRLGWAITRDKALREQLVRGKFNTVISCSPVDEALALGVFAARDRILAERRRRLGEGVARTEAWVAKNAAFVDWVRPDAGALCCVRLKPAIYDEDTAQRFYQALSVEGVRVGNGAWFGESSRIFRLGFGLLAPDDLDKGLAAMAAALRRTAEATTQSPPLAVNS
jgi:aspartate/methionine/tyrosine aminotransferase